MVRNKTENKKNNMNFDMQTPLFGEKKFVVIHRQGRDSSMYYPIASNGEK